MSKSASVPIPSIAVQTFDGNPPAGSLMPGAGNRCSMKANDGDGDDGDGEEMTAGCMTSMTLLSPADDPVHQGMVCREEEENEEEKFIPTK